MMNLMVHPKKVLIKITASEWENLFSIWVRRVDGTEIKLFTDMEESDGFEKRFQQNVSVGTVIAAGEKVRGIKKGDVAIIDYMVTGGDDALIGYQNGNKLVAIPAHTTYHTDSANPYIDGKRAWVEGDFGVISPLLGFVRLGKIYAMQPYVFLKYEKNTRMAVDKIGVRNEVVDEIITREVIGAHPDSGYVDGDKVIIKDTDLFSRVIDNKEISVVMESDIIGTS